jgi:hypothetical protein
MVTTRHRVRWLGPVLLLALVGAACGENSRSSHDPATGASAATVVPAQFRLDMRKLWEDHITWTRLYIVSAEAGAPDTDATAGRLLRNQEDIGNAIKPFYGDAAGVQLTALLKDHILTAADLLKAAKAGNNAQLATARTRWYANADQIADFLAGANPKYWPADEMRSGMHAHLDATLDEAVSHLKGDYPADIAAYDTIHNQILGMADMLADGITRQFPSKFS